MIESYSALMKLRLKGVRVSPHLNVPRPEFVVSRPRLQDGKMTYKKRTIEDRSRADANKTCYCEADGRPVKEVDDEDDSALR